MSEQGPLPEQLWLEQKLEQLKTMGDADMLAALRVTDLFCALRVFLEGGRVCAQRGALVGRGDTVSDAMVDLLSVHAAAISLRMRHDRERPLVRQVRDQLLKQYEGLVEGPDDDDVDDDEVDDFRPTKNTSAKGLKAFVLSNGEKKDGERYADAAARILGQLLIKACVEQGLHPDSVHLVSP